MAAVVNAAAHRATTATRLEPRCIERRQIALLNRLSRRRKAECRVEGVRLGLSLAAGEPPQPLVSLAAELTIGGHDARLSLPRPVVRGLLAALEPGSPMPALDDDRSLLLLELALTPLIERLETLLQRPIGNLAVPRRPADVPGTVTVCAEIMLDGAVGGTATLDLDEECATAIAGLVDRLPATPDPMPLLALPLAFRLGGVRLTVAELAGLAPGDVVLPDWQMPGAGEVAAVLGEGLYAAAGCTGGRVTLAAPLHPITGDERERWTMDDAREGRRLADLAAEALDELPVKLLFEIGRVDLPLGELRSLGPGHVFELGRDLSHPVEIHANSRRIGQGEIVRIGEAVGVRVTRLFGRM
jgi:type III secretion protein Q